MRFIFPYLAKPRQIAWGQRVSEAFCQKAQRIAYRLGVDVDHLMSCMAFETNKTFSASIRNIAGSGAVGLIQFMPSTAAALGTTIETLATMSSEAQLDYVFAYFKPWRGRLNNLGDLYMAILWPSGVGKNDRFVLFSKNDPNAPKNYIQNQGLDFDKDGLITRGETVAKVYRFLEEGLQPENVRHL